MPQRAGDAVIDETGARAAETTDDDQGAAYWRARAVSESARADQADAEVKRLRQRVRDARAVMKAVLDDAVFTGDAA